MKVTNAQGRVRLLGSLLKCTTHYWLTPSKTTRTLQSIDTVQVGKLVIPFLASWSGLMLYRYEGLEVECGIDPVQFFAAVGTTVMGCDIKNCSTEIQIHNAEQRFWM
jgi:hypothetical protein